MIEANEIQHTDRQKEVDRGTPLCDYALIAGIGYYNATAHFIPLPFARLMLGWSQVVWSRIA